jgi:hypothetical protein
MTQKIFVSTVAAQKFMAKVASKPSTRTIYQYPHYSLHKLKGYTVVLNGVPVTEDVYTLIDNE